MARTARSQELELTRNEPDDAASTPLTPDELDPYQYRPHVGWFTRLLWHSAGADAQLLRRCPESDRVKYQGIGGVVLTTGVLAFVSGSYAFYTIFGPKIGTALSNDPLDNVALAKSLGVGLMWAAMIYNLDRLIVSSAGKGDGTERITLQELVNAFPRIVMAVIFGLVLSAPLETRILKTEIDAELHARQKAHEQMLNDKSDQLVEDRKRELLERMSAAQARLDERPAEYEKRRQEILKQRHMLEMEAEGLTGSKKAGRGPAWQDKSNNLDRLEAELAEWKKTTSEQDEPIRKDIDRYRSDLADLEADIRKTRAENHQSAAQLDGLLERIKISHEIGGYVPMMIALMLLAVECGPIFFKLMMTTGVYEYLADNQKRLTNARWGIESREIPTGDGTRMHLTAQFHAAEAMVAAERARHQAEIALIAHQYELFVTEEKERMDTEARARGSNGASA